jgi:DNA-binding SARP family transcriptional activator
MALCNAGAALQYLGRLDDALDRFERAVAVEHRVGSAWLAWPLGDVGNVQRIRGRTHLARAAYEEAIRISSDSGDRYGLVPALAGLALTVADSEPATAAAAARRALEHAAGPMVVKARLALGHAVRGAGDRTGAAAIAQEAVAEARLHRDRPRLAEALELLGTVAADPAAGRRAWTEALQIWRDLGAVLAADRVAALIGARPDADAAERLAARLAADRLTAAWVPVPSATGAEAPSPTVRIRALGRFTVVVDGRLLPASVWQSRKARDLLRILVARRGRPVPREELGVLLWGDDDPGKVSHRLSVALSTVRSVLDPARSLAPDHYLIADTGALAVDLTRVVVDVEQFLSDAEHGFRLRDRDETSQARAVLTAAEQAYTGDFLEDEPFDETSAALREAARATYLRVLRVLVELHRRAGDVDECVRHLHRILAKDPYDEQCHRDLTEILEASGAHGEARRARQRYEAAMRDLAMPAFP